MFQDSCCLSCCRGGGEFIELPAEELSTIDRSFSSLLSLSPNPSLFLSFAFIYTFLSLVETSYNFSISITGQKKLLRRRTRRGLAGGCWTGGFIQNFLLLRNQILAQKHMLWNDYDRWADANPNNREMSKSLFNVRSRSVKLKDIHLKQHSRWYIGILIILWHSQCLMFLSKCRSGQTGKKGKHHRLRLWRWSLLPNNRNFCNLTLLSLFEGGGNAEGKQSGQPQLWLEEGDFGLRENRVEKDNKVK